MKNRLFRLCIAPVFFVLLPSIAGAQEFQKSYSVGEGGRVIVHNVSGNISVTGYEGNMILVNGFKEGRDRNRVEVEDHSGPERVELNVRYPHNCNCDASIRFEIKVPRSEKYRFDPLSTASGNVEVSGVTGELRVESASGDLLVKNVAGSTRASTASGNVRVKEVTGSVNANSVSGNVDVEIARLESGNGMKFSAVSGNVRVKLPANLDADVEMSTLSGSLRTDFPIEVEEQRFGPGKRAHGRLGKGSHTLHLSSTSGDVNLERF
jgi:hypothetical protein